MSYALKSVLALSAAALVVMSTGAAEAACASCRKPSKVVAGKTQVKYSTVRQYRNVTTYRDVYRIHYFVKVTKTVSRAEFLRFKASCKGACALARR